MDENLERLPGIELVSLYMNRYGRLGAEGRRALEAELARRGLPVPDLSAEAAAQPEAGPQPERPSLDPATAKSYFLLINAMTGIFYSWVFLASRLAHRGGGEPKHRAIQTCIALAYVAVEAAVLMLLGAE